MLEQSLVIIKPDGVKKGIIGEIITTFEKRGLTIKEMKMTTLETDVVKEHYAHLSDKPFFQDVIDFMISGPVVCLILEGPSGISAIRQMVGATNPLEAAPGTIRANFAFESGSNVIHASDSVEAANDEIKRFFA